MLILPVGNNIEKRDIPFMTIGLIVVNVLVFLHQTSAFMQAGSGELAWQGEIDFYNQFGLIPAELAQYKLLGLATHMFVHAGIMHLIGNMVMLYAIGPAVEYGLGRWTMLGFYGFFGLAGGAAHAAAAWGAEVPLVGASGAIAGVLGAYTVLYGPASKIRLMVIFGLRPHFFQVPALMFGGAWLFLQFANGLLSDSHGGGVAWWCHIGGFAAGSLLALICRNELETVLTQGNGDTIEMLSPEEIAAKEAREEAIRQHKADGLSGLLIPLQAEELAPPPTTCEHCDAELKDEDKIADQLFRCSGCERMIYLSVQQAEALATS